MISIFFKFFRAELRKNWLRVLLPLLGIIFGTAGYSSVRLSNESIIDSLKSTAQSSREDTRYILRSINGSVSEAVYQSILVSHPNIQLIPRIIRHLQAFDGEQSIGPITLVGVDLLKETGSGKANLNFLKDETFGISALPFENLQLVIGGQKKSLAIEQFVDERYSNTKLILVDIATAQRLLGEFEIIDEIGLSDSEGFKLPPGYQIVEAESFQGELLHTTRALRLNLHFLAMLCLVVSALLIYTSVSFTLLKRRYEIGVLLCTGVRRSIVVRGLLIEALTLGLVGALIGSVFGFIISSTVILEFSKTISALYVPVEARTVKFSLSIFFEVMTLGVLCSILGSISPILSESKNSLNHLLHPRTYETLFRSRIKYYPILGVILLLVCLLISSLNLLSYSLLLGFIPPTLLTLGWLLIAPSFSSSMLGLLKCLPSPEVFQLAVSQLQSSPRRVSATVAAAGVAIGLFLGVATMISSFRGTVSEWLETILKADVFISSEFPVAGESSPGIPLEAIRWLSSKGEIDTVQNRTILFQGKRVQVHGVSFDIIKKYHRLIFISGGESELDNSSVIVSESFSRKFGQLSELKLEGIGNFKIQGVFTDYSNDGGVVYFPQELFRNVFQQTTIQGLSLYLAPLDKSKSQQIIEDFREQFPQLRLNLRNGQELKNEVYKVFNQTFSITNALQLLALLLTLFVILNTILMLIIERKQDSATLWAIGLRKSKLIYMTALEGGILGGISALFGLLQGVCFAILLVFFINHFFFGWSISFSLSFWLFFVSFVSVTFVTLLLSAIPGMYRKFNSETLRSVR